MRWHPVAEAEALGMGRVSSVKVDGVELALAHHEEGWFALDDACPHQGASLGNGILVRDMVVCPWHSWAYDLRSGACRGMPGERVGCYPVRLHKGKVEIGLPDRGENA